MSMQEYLCFQCRHEWSEYCQGGGGLTYRQKSTKCPGSKGEEGNFGEKLPSFTPKTQEEIYKEK